VPDPTPFDHSRAAAFEERLVGVLNSGALCLMTSLGHRVGLFDAMADMPAAGSEAIAVRSGLNERYVREWLGAMVASGVVDYDPQDGTYAFPREHAAFLTRAATACIAHKSLRICERCRLIRRPFAILWRPYLTAQSQTAHGSHPNDVFLAQGVLAMNPAREVKTERFFADRRENAGIRRW
jgi:hypothetical protein